jgi:hypothetical protein
VHTQQALRLFLCLAFLGPLLQAHHLGHQRDPLFYDRVGPSGHGRHFAARPPLCGRQAHGYVVPLRSLPPHFRQHRVRSRFMLVMGACVPLPVIGSVIVRVGSGYPLPFRPLRLGFKHLTGRVVAMDVSPTQTFGTIKRQLEVGTCSGDDVMEFGCVKWSVWVGWCVRVARVWCRCGLPYRVGVSTCCPPSVCLLSIPPPRHHFAAAAWLGHWVHGPNRKWRALE